MMDIDIESELQLQDVEEFLSQFSQDFYVSETAVWQASCRRSCYSLINFGTSLKVDIYICRGRIFDRARMLRAETARMEGENVTIDVPIATEEDIFISKLECIC